MLPTERFKEFRSHAEGRRHDGLKPALIPAFSPWEKMKRAQLFGIQPRLDWRMRIKPDDSKGFSFSRGEKVGMRAGNSLSNQLPLWRGFFSLFMTFAERRLRRASGK
jgi:hypothetical protein